MIANGASPIESHDEDGTLPRGRHEQMANASIIIPAYNSEKTIAKTIDACKRQDYSGEFEIIVVDDGSKDSTGAKAWEAGAKVIKQENKGPAAARNEGARKSTGKILVFTDADCVPEKNWLREMLKPFKEAEVIGVQGAYKTNQRGLIARFNQIEIEERYEKMIASAQLDWIGSYSAAYRREDFLEANGFDESFPKASGEDSELSYKLAKAGKKLVFNPYAIVYHTHPETLQAYLKVKFNRAFYRVHLYSKHKDKIAKDSYTTQAIKAQIFLGLMADALFVAALSALVVARIETAEFLFGLSLLSWFFVAITSFPFMAFAWQRDPKVGAITPIIVLLRTHAFKGGLMAGAIKKVFK